MNELPVLFVDDEPEVLRALRRTVDRRPWPRVFAEGPEQALAELEKREFALVVSDFRMPRMDGVRFLTLVRERWPQVERILLTAFADGEALERGINEAGISRFLRKPWEREHFGSVLEAALAEGRIRREHEVLQQKLQNRNEELSYLNELLRESVKESARAMIGFRRRWDVALNAISDPLVIIDSEFRIEGANEAASQLGGMQSEELEGRRCHESLFGRVEPCTGCPIGTGTGQVKKSRARTELVLDARAYSLPGDKSSTLCVYRDITRELAFQAEAAQMEKMAAIGRLAGGVAHELNNPLHGILSFVQLAQKKDVAPDKLERYHQVIKECSIRCRDIVQSLRNFSRQAQNDERNPVDLRTVCERALVLFENIERADLEYREVDDPVFCLGNANQLQQVVVNLIHNAIDASPERGVVSVGVVAEGSEVVVAVEDQGQGVAPEVREKIFEPFFTTKPEGVGTGLGLAISHSIVRDHRGALKVMDSSLGGARFELRIPGLNATNSMEEGAYRAAN